jgi:hypothetical protein
MLTSHKLPLEFDPQLLQDDLSQILPHEWVPHFNKQYYEGEWKALALRSTTGKTNQIYRSPDDTREAIDTPTLTRCQNFRRVLDAFECRILAARLLSLGPGSRIREHEDQHIGPEYDQLRFHIPVVTGAGVEFFVNNQKLVMDEGQAWYIDFSLPHRVENLSDRNRVHLVIDCRINGWVMSMIPFDHRALTGPKY